MIFNYFNLYIFYIIMKSFIEEYFNIINLIGILATIFGALRFIPITLEINRTKKTNNFTVMTLILGSSSALLWIIYSYFTESLSLKLSGSLALSVYIYIIIIKSIYG